MGSIYIDRPIDMESSPDYNKQVIMTTDFMVIRDHTLDNLSLLLGVFFTILLQVRFKWGILIIFDEIYGIHI